MNALYKPLSKEEVESFGRELESLRNEIQMKLGEEDANYIRLIQKRARYFEVIGRLLIHFSVEPITWSTGVGFLSISKIMDNMELGHNVLHGQYDWMNDPNLNSKTFDWDNVTEKSQWQLSHNYMHHTFTNIIGKDHDMGYNMMRIDEKQPWSSYNLIQSVVNVFLSLIFEYGIGMHGRDVEYAILPESEKTKEKKKELSAKFHNKVSKQVVRDYLLFPALGLFAAPKILLGNLAANVIRNVWTYSIIFCGHFPENVITFTEEEVANETKAGWYLRQLKGSANLEGSKLFYMMSGHLSHQIEHHMFPDIPANRYEEMAPRVKEICEKYGQFYNTGNFLNQYATVWKKIFAYSFPNSIAGKILQAA